MVVHLSVGRRKPEPIAVCLSAGRREAKFTEVRPSERKMSLRCMFFGCASLPICTSKGSVSRGVRAPMPPLFVAVLVNVEKVTKKDKYKSSDRVTFF